MWKDVIIVGVAAGGGSWVAAKYGGKLEAWAVSKKLPPAAVHMGVVGLGAGAVFLAVKAFV